MSMEKCPWKITKEKYPERFRCMKDLPEALYGIGALPTDHQPSLAIVGARICSPYGKNIAYEFARVLSGKGIQIISGMALGIDGAAHQGALDGGGNTYAVLGCGVDVCYPAQNRRLYQQIPQRGGILSEYPCSSQPKAWHFPRRNRLISAMADGVLVVEARQKSGSLITADCALEQGKTVMAVPGRAGDPLSEGCHRLIAQGAAIVWNPERILEEMGWENAAPEKNRKKEFEEKFAGFGLASTDDLVYSCLGLYPKTLEEIQEETGLPRGILLSSLLHLELRKRAREIWKNNYVRVTDLENRETTGVGKANEFHGKV